MKRDRTGPYAGSRSCVFGCGTLKYFTYPTKFNSTSDFYAFPMPLRPVRLAPCETPSCVVCDESCRLLKAAFGRRLALTTLLRWHNGLDPYRYLRDVLERLPTQPASRVGELLPHSWMPLTTAS